MSIFEPVSYAKSIDGARIAWTSSGEGPPILFVPTPPFSHLQESLKFGHTLRFYEHLARDHRVLRYDCRGAGLSDRTVSDFSFTALVNDIAVVAQGAELDRYALFASFYAGPLAIAYAAEHSNEVTSLILFHSFVRTHEYLENSEIKALKSLISQDWNLYVEASAHMIAGWSHGDTANALAAIKRNAMSLESYEACSHSIATFDATEYLNQVLSDTLVIQRRDFKFVNTEMSRRLCSSIPGARLEIIDGDSGLMAAEDWHQCAELINSFLNKERSGVRPASNLTHREEEILCMIAVGLQNKQVASELSLSVHTVERHVANIYTKIGAKGRADAIYFAVRTGLV